MSMLIRTGTLVRKNTRKSSVRRTKSVGSTTSGGHVRASDDGDGQSMSSVPPSPVAKLHHLYTDHSNNSSPGKSSLATTTSTIVSLDDNRLTYKISLDKNFPASSNSQSTSLQIVEANVEADNVCQFLCTAAQIICSSSKY
ncbi:unnamed protein product [Candidula unifasciata]|uniref:Uncharacterized protein n=1 Tax=Candidula unifasciata TaxID=100452 RepID=A0A8S3YXS9_9EUPU|nr:unnamed protein product [Candidula unifasciata]